MIPTDASFTPRNGREHSTCTQTTGAKQLILTPTSGNTVTILNSSSPIQVTGDGTNWAAGAGYVPRSTADGARYSAALLSSSVPGVALDATGDVPLSNLVHQSISGHELYGDSTGVGQYSGNSPRIGGRGIGYYLNRDFPGGVVNYVTGTTNYSVGGGYAQNGAYATDVAQLQLFPLGPEKYGQGHDATFQYGLNDRHYTTSYQWAMDSAADLANDLWKLIPAEMMIRPGSGLITRGASAHWIINTTRIGANTPTLESNVNGNSLRNIPIRTSGGPIVIWYEAMDGNAGAATISIDGTNVGTLRSGNSCTMPSSTSGLCIYTRGWLTDRTPQAAMLPVPPGNHTVTLTVTGANGSGMGFSLIGLGTTGISISVATNPVNSALPRVYHGDVLRTPSYRAGSIDDTISKLYKNNVIALQAIGLPLFYVCGLAGDYASFPASAVQPKGCSDVKAFSLDNTLLNISTEAYDSASGLLTLGMAAAIPASMNVGDEEIIAATDVHPELSNVAFWNVVSKSGTTLVLEQPGFTALTWTTVSETSGIVAKDFYNDPHPNKHGYEKMYQSFNHYIKAGGGGSEHYVPPSNLNLNLSYPVSNYALLGNEGIVEEFCSAGNNFKVTLPSHPVTNATSLTVQVNNGEYVISNTGTSYCPVVLPSGSSLTVLGPRQGIFVHAANATNDYIIDGSTTASAWDISCTNISASYTLTGKESCIKTTASSVLKLTFPGAPVGNGPIPVYNLGTQPVLNAAASGANLGNIPSSLAPGYSETVQATTGGPSAHWNLQSSTQNGLVGPQPTISSNGTIYLPVGVSSFYMSGRAAINTMTPPPGFSTNTGGCVDVLAAPSAAWTIASGGNFKATQSAVTPGLKYRYCYFGGTWY